VTCEQQNTPIWVYKSNALFIVRQYATTHIDLWIKTNTSINSFSENVVNNEITPKLVIRKKTMKIKTLSKIFKHIEYSDNGHDQNTGCHKIEKYYVN
jgi:hypothetical protein